MNDKILDGIDRLNEIGECWQAVGDLMSVSNDALQTPQRDRVGTLLNYLQREYAAASRALHRTIVTETRA